MVRFAPSRHKTAALLLLTLVALASTTLIAQQTAPQHRVQLVHLAPAAMSAQDSNTVQARQAELIQATRIYGYNIEAGNWTYDQTLCAFMPQTILLRYRQIFPDGTESLFTALVPRESGRVRIVPVLYRNATPFVPAPQNPRNAALFNELVPPEIAARALSADGDWLELGACYAEMTGARVHLPPGATVRIGVADAPTATLHLDSKTRTSRITFADQVTASQYRVWSIALNRQGRVTSARTQDYPIYIAKTTSPVVSPSLPSSQPATGLAPENASATQGIQPKPGIPAPSIQPVQPAYSSPQTQQPAIAGMRPATPQPEAVRPSATDQTNEPGWKFIPQAPLPPSKFVPSAPPPPSKIIPEPPDSWN